MIRYSAVTHAARRAALSATAALAVVLALAAAADPSGLLAVVAWQGSRPVPALWWWAPYLSYLPALLAANYLGVRALLGATLAGAARRRVFLELWGIAVLCTAAAAFLCSLVIMTRELGTGRLVLPAASMLAFLLWSSGYAALKMLLLGWLPALAGARAWRPVRLPEESRASSDLALPAPARVRLAVLIAGGGLIVLALLGPWLAQHWWQGSPVGYAYSADRWLFAPTPASGIWLELAALALCGAATYLAVSGALKGLSGAASAGALFWVGAIAALAVAGSLLLTQTLLALALVPATPVHDIWQLPATCLRAVEAGSFALVIALPLGLLAVLGARLRSRAAIRGVRGGGSPARSAALLAGAALALCLLQARAPSAAAPPAPMAPLAAATATPTAIDAHGAPLRPLSVQVDAAGAMIADSSGAQLTLRGINVNQLNEYYRAEPRLADVVALTEQDFADIAALGLNSVRLTLSWSRLEPRRGEISDAYLEQVHQAVEWAGRHGPYVILDMHQDAWGASVVAPRQTRCRAGSSPMTGWDGAPGWATLTDDQPPCQITGRDLAPNVARAFQSFYFDREGIQSELIRAWAVLARSFAADSTVAGYDLLNEPNFAESPPLSSTLLLANYYARCIRALRAAEASTPHGFAHLVLIEPSIIWSGFGFDNLPPRDFTADRQIVFSPHLYNESITADQDLGVNLASIERGFVLARRAAAQLHAPLWIGEWGFFGDPAAQAPLRDRQAQAEDRARAGSAVWVWRQACGDPHVYPGSIAGNIRRRGCPEGQELPTLAAATVQLGRPYARSAPGHILELRAGSRRLELSGARELTATASAAPACGLELWIPGEAQPVLSEAAGVGEIAMRRVASGSALLGPSGGWLLEGCVTAARYRVTVQ